MNNRGQKVQKPIMPKKSNLLFFVMVFLIVLFALPISSIVASEIDRYTYAWPFEKKSSMRPRGGFTKGPQVKIGSRGHSYHLSSNLSDFEKDRAAILSLQGGYRATFDFIEIIGFENDYSPKPPYQSWGTEYVYVVKDEKNFISLQHILVMRFIQENGKISKAHVMKHWRQDWKYQDADLHVYAGNGSWHRKILSPNEIKGTWSQAVFQVDDSPRYEAIGTWVHSGSSSIWESQITDRPLPRREFSIRDDYQMLRGTNRISITPSGWVHEEDNLKTVLMNNGQIDSKFPFLAREAGIARYELIEGYDFTPGDEYVAKTKKFWEVVRSSWADIIQQNDKFEIKGSVEGKKLYETMFELANDVGNNPDKHTKLNLVVENILKNFVNFELKSSKDVKLDNPDRPY